MLKEFAKYANLAGYISTTLAYFKNSGKHKETAECFSELGKNNQAAQIHCKEDIWKEAIREYKILLEKGEDLAHLNFDSKEIDTIKKYLIKDGTDIQLADILVRKDELVPLLTYLIKGKKLKRPEKST